MGECQDPLVSAVSAPRKAEPLALSPGTRTADAAAIMLAECASQIRANAELVRISEDPEAAHQLRVGLRRLRSAVRCLAPFCAGLDGSDIVKEARWLGRQVATLRDLDVLALRLREASARWPEEPGFPALETTIARRAADARTALRRRLEDKRARRFLSGLSDPPRCSGRKARTVARDLAQDALDAAWKRVLRLGRKTAKLDTEGRHDLRKALKHLRYTVDFFAPLYREGRVDRYARTLKRMQDLLGDLNDLAMAERMLAAVAGPEGAQTIQARDRLLDHMRRDADAHWSDARKVWQALRRSPKFWREKR